MTPKIVLAMIMKNEESVLPRSLGAALPLIDAYAIVDTGSTDRSREVAREVLAGLPGEIVDIEWTGFADARNKSLELAAKYGEWIFVLDADDLVELHVPKQDVMKQLNGHVHPVRIQDRETVFTRSTFIHRDTKLEYKCVVHEFLDLREIGYFSPLIEGMTVQYNAAGVGSRNRDQKATYERDIDMIVAALVDCDDPGLSARYTYYLGQTYLRLGRSDDAFRTFERRVQLTDGYDQEIYVSYVNMGHLAARLGHSAPERLHHFLMAYETDPERAEAQFFIAELCRANGWWDIGWRFITDGCERRMNPNKLFNDASVYRWRLDYERSIAAYYVRASAEGRDACLRLLALDGIPPEVREVTTRNLAYYPPSV